MTREARDCKPANPTPDETVVECLCAGEEDYLQERRRDLRRSGKRTSVAVDRSTSDGARAILRVSANPVAGRVLGTGDNIYKIKAVFWPKDFQAFTTQRNVNGDPLSIAMDYLDYLVIYLDTCATSGSDSAKLAGAAFSDLDKARGGGPGLLTKFWGYGEDEMGKANYDGIARTATYNWTRATSTSGAAGHKNMWIDCHFLDDSASTCARFPARPCDCLPILV